MTAVSSLIGAAKPAEESTPTGEVNAPAPAPTAPSDSRRVYKGTIFFRSNARRRRQRRSATTTARYALLIIVSMTILVDVYALLTREPEHQGILSKYSGIPSTYNIYMLLVLHTLTLWGGLSRTVLGCRIATAISWLFVMASMVLLLLVPGFIGSYVGSGLAPVAQNGTLLSQVEPYQRFQTAFYMAVGGQLFIFVVFMSAIFQLTLCIQLLAEAHMLRIVKRAKAQATNTLIQNP